MTRDGLLLGLDVGGTSTAAGLVTRDGQVLETRSQPTHGADGDGAVARILAIAADVAALPAARSRGLVGVGAGLPGVVDVAAGTVGGEAHHVPELAGVRIASLLAEAAGVPAFVDNDVNALALSEGRWGAGRGARSFVLVAIGTGVGGGIVLDGRLYRGAGGFGGELGHVPIAFDGRPCICGARGCLKAFVAGPDLGAEGSRRLGRPVDAAALFDLAEQSGSTAERSLAAAVLDEATEALAAGLAIIVNGLNPERLLVGGTVGQAFARRESDLRARLARRAYAGALATTEIRFLHLVKRATVRGGAALVLYEREGPAAP
ncbi:MAG TPA: ROK family protein [Candidatus Bathyarchaeia archaeon]|nr:ROK family protein [Candidatus Bathyarchaeia archaeon]